MHVSAPSASHPADLLAERRRLRLLLPFHLDNVHPGLHFRLPFGLPFGLVMVRAQRRHPLLRLLEALHQRQRVPELLRGVWEQELRVERNKDCRK